MLTVKIHLALLVIILLILQQSIPSYAGRINRIDDYSPSLSFVEGQPSFHQRRSSLWSKLFRPNQRKMPSTHSQHELHIRNAVIHLIPQKKRTIPLELQKALYAHGIVGRRR